MPYNRRKRYNNYRRKRYYRKKKPGYFGKFGSDASKAIRMAGKALALINTEHKAVDVTNLGGSSLSLNASRVIHLNPIFQGTDDDQRIGNSVKNTSLYIRDYLVNPSLTDVKIVRRLVVKWYSPNGASTPSILDILQYNNIISPRNIDKAKMFKILADDIIYLPAKTNPRRLYEKYIKLSVDGSDDHTEYTANPASQLVNTNGYYTIYIANEITDPVTVEYMSRLRYIDN